MGPVVVDATMAICWTAREGMASGPMNLSEILSRTAPNRH